MRVSVSRDVPSREFSAATATRLPEEGLGQGGSTSVMAEATLDEALGFNAFGHLLQ
jgi:hypothetical protein